MTATQNSHKLILDTKMPSLSSTYLIPALFLNPAFILHLINTFVSHWVPPPPTASISPHPVFETLGPVPGSTPYLDMHADDQLCWSYTALMVFVQLLAFGKVNDTRGRRKERKAARLERERLKKEKADILDAEGNRTPMPNGGRATGMDGAYDFPDSSALKTPTGNGQTEFDYKIHETDESMTETSEEEMIV